MKYSKYCLILWLGVCIILLCDFYMEIKHQKRIDMIFDEYYKNIANIKK